MSNTEEKSSKVGADMLPLLSVRNKSFNLSEELLQCCDQEDMLTEMYRKDFEKEIKTAFQEIYEVKVNVWCKRPSNYLRLSVKCTIL